MTLAEGPTARTGTPAPPFAIDVLDPRFYDDPWDAYRWLRANAPLWWDARNELWVVSRHEDLSHISRHPGTYSAAQGVRPKVASPMSIISMDDPEHTRQRRLITRGFTPRRVRELADHIRELSNEIIDEIAERGECDFVEDFAIHVPLIVIAELMGLDPDERQKLYRWSDAMMAGDGHTDPDDPVLLAAAEAGAEFATVCIEHIEARRATGSTGDLIGTLTAAFDDGSLAQTGNGAFAGNTAAPAREGLTHDELLMFLIVLVVAGNETTRNALTGGLMAFSRFPDQHRKLIEQPELIDLAVDEIVRYVSPVMSFMRTVTTDHTYQGVDLRAGDRVFLLYQSANRDETVFDDPDAFRIDRDPNPHLGFGIGTHYCLGANLARAEISVVFTELFARLRDIRAVDPDRIDRGDSSLVLALRHLPAVFTPESRA
ncbi:MAG TPA: cytochrome P450 [Acidimicrobiales bacterium]|nr:cytochrome P450 [Acidimicrobiales bacterium]